MYEEEGGGGRRRRGKQFSPHLEAVLLFGVEAPVVEVQLLAKVVQQGGIAVQMVLEAVFVNVIPL